MHIIIRNTGQATAPTPQLQPKKLFPAPDTPTSITRAKFPPVTPSTPNLAESPVSAAWSPATSEISVTSSHSSLTPSFGSMALGRGRGRPRKKVQPPSYDDYPVDAPKDVQERWVQKKATEQW